MINHKRTDMLFSIIMPSYLTPYKNSATNLEQKILRAIDSVLKQSFESWELIVVADGCKKTIEIVEPLVYEYLPQIRLLEIPKQKQWSGQVRNAGIFKADGTIITYLDVDDFWGVDHLKKIIENFKDNDWVFFNDLVYDKKTSEWKENKANFIRGNCGTSNIAHKRNLNIYWTNDSYLHDFVMIQSLLGASKKYEIIPCCEYYVCHKPYPYYDI